VPAGIKQLKWAGGSAAFGWGDMPRLVRDLRRVVKDVRPDLIHAGPIQTCAFLAVLSRFQPILTMSWGYDLMQDADRDPWWRWVTRYTLQRSSFFVSDARITRAKAISLGMRPDRIAVFPWGVDLLHFRPPSHGQSKSTGRGRKTLSQRSRKTARQSFVLLCNRSWEPRYGVDVLVRAFVLAARRQENLSLILLGGGSQGNAFRQILLDAGQIDRVQFAGHVTNASLPRWYHMADLFVSPSHVDGSSVSLMEALACGTPVLVSDIPANKEWVRNGVNGWLFCDGDIEALSEQLLQISSHPAALPRISRAARKVAEARADWNRNFRVLLRSYQRVVAMS
jgi:glycosyltransferase involved in cell wall biosynthesis